MACPAVPGTPGGFECSCGNDEKKRSGDFVKEFPRDAPQHAQKISRRRKKTDTLCCHMQILVQNEPHFRGCVAKSKWGMNRIVPLQNGPIRPRNLPYTDMPLLSVKYPVWEVVKWSSWPAVCSN